ncbi:MAG: purine/pyrimidine permease [Bacteroidales bacterium]|jgi:xanthine permease XanP|nr:purine/pyrimidine permease [Bacteroidales bacterium]
MKILKSHKIQSQPFSALLVMAVQLLAASIATIIAPPVIIADQLGLPAQDATVLVSMSLIAAGIATFLQCKRFGRIGVGMIVIEGANVTFLAMVVAFGQKMLRQGLQVESVLGTVFGTLLAASIVVIAMSFIVKYIKKFFPPFVLGIMLALVGLCLLKVFMIASAGGENVISQLNISAEAATTVIFKNLAVALTVIIIMLAGQFSRIKLISSGSTLWAFAIGILLAWIFGILPEYVPADRTIVFPEIMKYRPFGFHGGFFASTVVLSLFYMLLNMGVLSDLCRVYGIDPSSKECTKRISGGLSAVGINGVISSLFCLLPTTPYAQINGMVELSGIKDRRAGYITALMLVMTGLFPPVTALFVCIPQPVLGGISLLLFGTIAVSGFQMMLSENTLDKNVSVRTIMIIAVSLALGLGVELYPAAASVLPDIFTSGINVGGLCAVVLNWVIPKERR